MKNLAFLFIAFFLLQISATPQDFYPLEIGNRWDYNRTYWEPGNPQEIDTFSVEVIGDSLFPNGETYYVLNQWDLTGGKFVRADSDFVYYYDENDAEEDTVYRLNAQPGEEWFLQFGATSTIRLDSISTSQIFTFPTTLLYFRFDGLILSFVILSDKLGPVNFHSPGEPPGTAFTDIHLLGCMIDSIEYGEPVSVDMGTSIPNEFTLYHNYPNPFNPSTKIQFSLPQTSFVTLEVFNLLGKSVDVLVSEELNAGTYNYNWDATSQTSGIYFYKLQAGNVVETKKMVLMK